jgi:outer membrane biosynthesis protein TonB
VYESIHTTDGARKKGIIWWVAIGVTAAAAIGFMAYSVITRGNRGGIEDTGQPTLTVDETPEERPTAPPLIDRDAPTPGDGVVDEDATEGMDEDATEGLDEDATEGMEEPTPPEESPTETPDREEPPTEPATPEPPTPEPVTPEPPTPEPPTPAPPATGDNPWLVAANNPTTEQPTDPSNPWAAAANAAQSGKMTVSSTPVGADFFVDGTRKGTTPLTVDVPFGHHNVRVEKDGHVGQERPVSVQSGTVFVDFTLEKTAAPAAGKLTVFTNPQPGATLFVDGAARGKTPVTLDITPGVHTLRVELAGFPTKEETIDLSDLQPGENRRRVISME